MTIDMLNNKTILVTLQQEDIHRYALDFLSDKDTDKTRRGLTELMTRVGEMCGLDHRGRSYLIEALPSKESCLLIISIRSTRRKKYRIKREKKQTICIFDTVDAMLDWMDVDGSGGFGYAVYHYLEHYVLLPHHSMPSSALSSLCEYGRVLSVSPVAAARVREYGSLLKEFYARRQFAKKASSAAT